MGNTKQNNRNRKSENWKQRVRKIMKRMKIEK